MGRFGWLFCCMALFATGNPSLAQVIDGSRNPDAFSDREALGVLFTIARSGQPGGWDLATRHRYLMELGLTREEAFRLIEAADAWFQAIHPLDAELRELGRMAAGRPLTPQSRAQADALAAKKLALLDESLQHLRWKLGSAGTPRLDQALLLVKRGMKAYVAGTPPHRIEKNDPGRH